MSAATILHQQNHQRTDEEEVLDGKRPSLLCTNQTADSLLATAFQGRLHQDCLGRVLPIRTTTSFFILATSVLVRMR